jgi:PAS domain S-box-containing protein
VAGTEPVSPRPIQASTEQLLDSAPDAMVIIDGSGQIRLVNRQAEALFGYRRDELLGQPVELLVPDRVRAGHPDQRRGYFNRPSTRPMGAGLELGARRKDGTEFPVDISLSSLETEDGVLVSAAVRDITDRKRAEQEQAQLEARLAQAQRDEERAMLEAQLHQAQRLESIGQLAGGVAHDFNNLLAGIMNYAGLVATTITEQTERLGLTNDPEFVTLSQDVAEISNVAKRAAALTHQLLIFSRREVVQPEVLDLNSVVADLEKLLGRTIGEDIDLQTQFGDDLPRINADRGQVEQVFMNLAVNARDAMSSGGRLTIETNAFDADEDYAHSHATTPGRYVRLTMSDTGTGMSPEVVARAFEPFFTTKAKGEGSGLGLATVYGIVTQAGGDVVIYSEPGLGTTIRVNFPATDDPVAGRKTNGNIAPPASNGEMILLVEDEEIVREPARRMLVKHGYEVVAASSAEEALAILQDDPRIVHLLLTDVVMPGQSGKELAQEVTRQRPDVRVLYMSGYSQDVIVHQGVLEAGVHLIEKPFSSDALLARVRDVLDAERD